MTRLGLALAFALSLAPPAAIAADVRTIDGDTIDVDGERIRIAGVDTPELRGKCDAERRLARIARDRLAEIVAAGPIEIRRHGRGRYGRTIADLSVRGRDVGEALIAADLARAWTGRREPWCE